MAAITDFVNVGADPTVNVEGLNFSKQKLKKTNSIRFIWWLAPGTSITTNTLAEIKTLIAQGKLKVQRGINTFEENGDDDSIETLDDGTQQLTNEGKMAFEWTSTNGLDFVRAFKSMAGFGQWQPVLGFSTGDMLGTKDAAGQLRGFTAGLMRLGKTMIATTSEGQKERGYFQLLERDEFDVEFAFIDRENLEYNPLKVEDITQCKMSYVNTPADTDTTITVKVTTGDGITPVEGLDYTYFRRVSQSATSNPTAGDDSATPGTYVLTVAAVSTGDVETIELYDNSNNRNVIEDTDGDLFKSNTATATATA